MLSVILGLIILLLLSLNIILGNEQDSIKKRIKKLVAAGALSLACAIVFNYIEPLLPDMTEVLPWTSTGEETGQNLAETETADDADDQQEQEEKTSEYTGFTSFISILILKEGDVDESSYTAKYTGTHYFYANTSSNVDVMLEIYDSDGNMLYRSKNEIYADLEEDMTYTVSTGYVNGACSGTVNIVEPSQIKDLGESVMGVIVSDATIDRYYFKPTTTKLYTLKVRTSNEFHLVVRISDREGNSLNYGTDEVSMVLDSLNTYIISIEYVDGLSAYELTVE